VVGGGETLVSSVFADFTTTETPSSDPLEWDTSSNPEGDLIAGAVVSYLEELGAVPATTTAAWP